MSPSWQQHSSLHQILLWPLHSLLLKGYSRWQGPTQSHQSSSRSFVNLDGNIQLSLTANQVPRSKIHQQKKQLGQERNLSKPSWEGNLRRVGQVILHHYIYLISIETILDELWCPPLSKHPNGSKWQQQGARWALPHVQRASRNNGSTCKMGKLSNSSRRYRR